jgi:hypothetical protein
MRAVSKHFARHAFAASRATQRRNYHGRKDSATSFFAFGSE